MPIGESAGQYCLGLLLFAPELGEPSVIQWDGGLGRSSLVVLP